MEGLGPAPLNIIQNRNNPSIIPWPAPEFRGRSLDCFDCQRIVNDLPVKYLATILISQPGQFRSKILVIISLCSIKLKPFSISIAVISHMSCGMCKKSCVRSNFFFTKWWSYSVEGLLSTGSTPSSLNSKRYLVWLGSHKILISFQARSIQNRHNIVKLFFIWEIREDLFCILLTV